MRKWRGDRGPRNKIETPKISPLKFHFSGMCSRGDIFDMQKCQCSLGLKNETFMNFWRHFGQYRKKNKISEIHMIRAQFYVSRIPV